MWRQMNFEEAPMIPREDLPMHLQPQSSIRGKVINYINGVDPRLPKNSNLTEKRNQITSVEMQVQSNADPESGDPTNQQLNRFAIND